MKFKCLLLTVFWFFVQPPTAPAEPIKDLCELPKNMDSPNPSIPGLVTEETISMTGLTVPSLWWDTEQFDPFEGQLISHWMAYVQEKRIDLIVNRQLWALMDYVQRYSYVNQLGTVAKEYQYDLRILAAPDHCLATYVCQVKKDIPQNCLIHFDSPEQPGLETKRGVGF